MIYRLAAGFGISIALTLLAYFVVVGHLFEKWITYSLVGALAVGQAYTQLILFLDVGRESKPRWNLIMFYCTLLILITVVTGTLWIMHHLNYNLMGH